MVIMLYPKEYLYVCTDLVNSHTSRQYLVLNMSPSNSLCALFKSAQTIPLMAS